MYVYVCERVGDGARENMSKSSLHEEIERGERGEGRARASLCMMYHVADCVAAAIASKNKGVFMSSLTDLVFINVLPPFLPHYHELPHITPLPPLY